MSLTAKIRELSPAGTRMRGYAVQCVTADLPAEIRSEAIDYIKRKMAKQLPEPTRFIVLKTMELDPVEDADLVPPHLVQVSDTVVVGFTLGAIPGELPYWVAYGQGGDQQGRWHERTFTSRDMIFLSDPSISTVVARSTGEVEVREDGALAEVYRVAI